MTKAKFISSTILLIALSACLSTLQAGEAPKPKAKPYPLDTCAVCGMKLTDVGKPFVFEYQDREIKVCDKGEAADFKKDPARYLKQIEAAEAKAKK